MALTIGRIGGAIILRDLGVNGIASNSTLTSRAAAGRRCVNEMRALI